MTTRVQPPIQPPRHRLPPAPTRTPNPQVWTIPKTPIAAGFAVVCASTALSGVLQGLAWLFYLAVTVSLVVGTGMVLRALRLPIPLIGLGQLFALMCMLTMAFTTSGILLVLPGPTALGDLLSVLHQALVEVQTKASPVVADTPMLCLVLVAIGLVAIVVDTLAIAAEAPAASGLVLLCVYAVPASLSDDLLPWWSFILGAVSFAVLLAVDGKQRHLAWRGRRTGLPSPAEGSNQEATGVVAIAIVLALVVGSTFTLIGTVGKLPGGGSGDGGSASTLGIKPFTKLSGLLQQSQGTKELFRVHGLTTASYLRILTLDKYTPNDGWEVGHDINGGMPLDNSDLTASTGPTTRIQIDPVGFADRWVPIYGVPKGLTQLGNNWYFDPITGTVNTPANRQAGSYVETAQLAVPTAAQLRAEDHAQGPPVDSRYLQQAQVSPRVKALIQTITGQYSTTFDKAAALTKYFNGGANNFRYDVRAVPKDGTIDKLDDFLFNTKTGYCEQYASALAAMLRSMGVPTRVAIGFTQGVVSQSNDYRSILGSDAHAWVEVYFPTYGWITFEPTPLSGGRGMTPPYLQNDQTQGGAGGLPDGGKVNSSSGPEKPTSASTPTTSAQAAAPQSQQASGEDRTWMIWALVGVVLAALLLSYLARGSRIRLAPSLARFVLPLAIGCWALVVVLLLAFVSWWLAVLMALLGLVATPALIRQARRRARLHQVSSLGADAPSAAWAELIAESLDRGATVSDAETVRATARRLAREHDLDEAGREALRQVITAVEGSWYGGRAEADPELVAAVDELRASLNRSAPLALRAKVLPRSVLGR